MAILKAEDLFDFKDNQSIDELIAKIEKLNSVYDTLVSSATKNSEAYAKSLDTVLKSVDELESSITKLDVANKKDQEALAKSASAMDSLAGDSEKYTKSVKETEQQIQVLVDQQNKLQHAKERLTAANEEEAGSIATLRKELNSAVEAYYAMGESVDAAVKDKALSRITELSKAVTAGEKAVKEAKKASDAAAGSYNELSNKVAAATKQLKAMEGGIGSSSKQFKELQKFVKDGNDQLKKFDEAVGVNTRHVGGYKEQIEKLIPAFKKINPELVEMGENFVSLGKKGLALVLSPIGVVLGTIAAAIALATHAVHVFTESTVEGADKSNIALSRIRATNDVLKSSFKDLGKIIFDTLFGSAEDAGVLDAALFHLISTFFGLAKAAEIFAKVEAQTQNRIASAKLENEIRKEEIKLTVELADLELEKAKQLFISRDKLLHNAQERYEATKKAGEIADEQTTLELASIDKQIAAINKVTKLKEGESAATAMQTLMDADLANEKKDNYGKEIKLQANLNDLLKMRAVYLADPNLTDGDKERLKAIEEQIKPTENLLRLNKISYEVFEKLAALQAKRKNTETQAFEESKNRQKLEIQQVEESLNLRIRIENDFDSASRKLLTARVEADKKAAIEIIGHQKYSEEEQLKASEEFYTAELKLLDISKKNQEASLLESARQRVVIDSETSKKIFDQAKNDLGLRTQLLDEAQREAIKNDLSYRIESAAIDQQYATQQIELLRKVTADAEKIIDDRYNYFIALEKQGNKKLTEVELTNLNKRFQASKISLKNYNAQTDAILKAQSAKDIQDQLNKLDQELRVLQIFYLKNGKITEEGERAITRIKATQISLRKTQSEADIANQIEAARRINAIVIQLRQEAVNTILSVGDNLFQGEQDQLDYRIQQLEDHRDNELAIAGDNAAQKIEIENNYNKQIESAKRELRDSQRKQAIFDKALSAVGIGINTAAAIIAALAPPPIGVGPVAGIPLGFAIGAVGALQLATVLSKPIPAFFTGVESSPETWATVGEKGRELAFDRKTGKATLYQEPQLTHLNAGTKIFSNSETEQIASMLAMDQLIRSQRNDVSALSYGNGDEWSLRELRNLGTKLDELNYLFRTKKDRQPDPHSIGKALARELKDQMNIKNYYK